jgi:hypothetical protein
MKFVCLRYMEESQWDEMSESDSLSETLRERTALMNECFAYDGELRRGGHLISGEALQSVRNAATLRYRHGKVAVKTWAPLFENYTQQLHAKGQYLSASPLHSVATATSVRVREGKRLITDGPFAETHEQLGGYYLIDVKNLDEAIAIAGQIPGVKIGTVEIRPILELPDLPAD